MAYSKARRLSDSISATGEVSAFVDGSITHADLHTDMDLTGKTVLVANASTGDSDTTVANTAFVQQEIAALVASAPGTLNTLNELAAALGDDASFSTTVTNSIATKLPLAGGTMTGALAMNTNAITSTGDLTLDAAGNISLDADGGSTFFKDGGTEFFKVRNTGSDVQLYSARSDADIKIEGVDGSTGITALRLDMGEAGKATFNAGATFANATVHYGNGAAPIDWGDTSTVGQLSFSGSTAIIRSSVSDGDMILQGNDNGSFISALTLDMSDAGTATFNNKVIIDTLELAPEGSNDIIKSTGSVLYLKANELSIQNNSGNERFVVKSDGRVGINRTPAITNSKLEVGGADNVPLINVEASGNTGGIGIGSTGLQFFHGTTKKMTINSNYVIPKMNFNYSGANTGAQSTTGDENNSASGVQMLKQQITVAAGSRVMVWAESGQIGAFSFGAHNPQLAIYIDSSSTSPSRGQSHRINKDNDHYWYPMSTSNSRLFLSAIGGKTISTAGTYYIYVYGGAYNGGSFIFNYQGVTRGCSIIWAEVQG